jgi:hypothetical protein
MNMVNVYKNAHMKKFITLSPFIVLCFQNLLLFWRHYFRTTGFPWDFLMSYFPWVAFWVSAIQKGIIPKWIPFQSMGYPFAMQIQSGFYYPVFWIVAILGVPYTFKVAVVIQCLHVLAGSLGMYLLARLFVEKKYALIGAIAFQFFGGFLGNSQHSDIIRSYALTPWAIYVTTLNLQNIQVMLLIYQAESVKRKKRLLNFLQAVPKRIFFIPLIIFLMSTGGYPGNLIAAISILTFYIIAQIILGYIYYKNGDYFLGLIFLLVTLMVLGFGLSIIQLGPPWLFRDEISRYSEFRNMGTFDIWVDQWPGLFLSSASLPGEISETSSFVTIPIIVFLGFISISVIKKNPIIVFIIIITTLMVGGSHSFFWRLISTIFSPLAYSRFPTSDYRALWCTFIILLSLLCLENLVKHRVSGASLFLRSSIISLILLQGIYFTYYPLENNNLQLLKSIDTYNINIFNFLGRYFASTNSYNNLVRLLFDPIHIRSFIAIGVIILCFAIIILINKSTFSRRIYLLLLALTLFDGIRFSTDMYTWRDYIGNDVWYQSDIPLFQNGRYVPLTIFENLPLVRPARKSSDNSYDFSWRGYLDGSYMTSDYKPCPIMSCKTIEGDNLLQKYMQMAWTPILLKAQDFQGTITNDLISEALQIEDAGSSKLGWVIQTFYGMNDISYEVDLSNPTMLIENETYFPGWKAIITYPDGSVKTIDAININNALRGWSLPAGKYIMNASFSFPYMSFFTIISLSSLLIWVVMISISYSKRTGSNDAD